MSSGMVRRWVRDFKNGRTDVHDEARAGRPSASDETIAKVEAAMLEDRRTTVRELCEKIPEVSKTTIDKILTEHLGYSKVCARWVPKMLTADHKRQRVEAAQEFLAFHGTTEEEFLDSIVTGDETWTCNSEQEKRNADKKVRFHHDNARPHTANRTTALAERFGWEMVSHPPYSPDLAPSDFHLFPELKKTLAEPNSRQMKRCKTRLLIFYTDRRQSSITLV
ncbi:histone-lysine N-methyltransferase SETMAR [Trichonephila clavipes]|nr:histone-lysine N-methyltransferase SETMAR [Trichonephila clavipes]